jgi:hypothetical protein
VEGSGSIFVSNDTAAILSSGGQAIFSLHVEKGKKGKTKGNFTYSDPAAPLSFSATKLSALVITGNHAQFSGKAKLGKKSKITFTVDVTDNGDPGTLDTFSISVSTGYSAGGNLNSGNIQIQ